MSLHDKIPCPCGHPRLAHATWNTRAGVRRIHCQRCPCKRFIDLLFIGMDGHSRAPDGRYYALTRSGTATLLVVQPDGERFGVWKTVAEWPT